MKKRLTLILASMLLCVATALAQTKVSGTVISQDDGQPVIGASVVVEGQRTGVVTDVNGRFTLTVPKNKKISVSYIGMATQRVEPKDGMTITLEADDAAPK